MGRYKRSHCQRGHRLWGENVMYIKDKKLGTTWRRCRTCHNASSSKAQRKMLKAEREAKAAKESEGG